MSEYVITINSTSDLPKEWVWERKIPVVPLNCTIGGHTGPGMVAVVCMGVHR